MSRRFTSCRRKRRFDEQWQALAAAHAIREKTGEDRGAPYRCEFCDGWHLGHRYPGDRYTAGLKGTA